MQTIVQYCCQNEENQYVIEINQNTQAQTIIAITMLYDETLVDNQSQEQEPQSFQQDLCSKESPTEKSSGYQTSKSQNKRVNERWPQTGQYYHDMNDKCIFIAIQQDIDRNNFDEQEYQDSILSNISITQESNNRYFYCSGYLNFKQDLTQQIQNSEQSNETIILSDDTLQQKQQKQIYKKNKQDTQWQYLDRSFIQTYSLNTQQ
ncbi:hypothetical protein ABPG74_011912 [Tetrahymena malaccensis]